MVNGFDDDRFDGKSVGMEVFIWCCIKVSTWDECL